MLDFILDILLFLLGGGRLRKRKKEITPVTDETNGLIHDHNVVGGMTREGLTVCAGCHRRLEKGAIYELGKVWCTECYKTHVLKIKQ